MFAGFSGFNGGETTDSSARRQKKGAFKNFARKSYSAAPKRPKIRTAYILSASSRFFSGRGDIWQNF